MTATNTTTGNWAEIIWADNHEVLKPLLDAMLADSVIMDAIRATVRLEREGRSDQAAPIVDWLLTQPSYMAYEAAWHEIHARYVASTEPNDRTVSPEFREAMTEYLAVVRAGRGETEEGQIVFMRTMNLAPDWMLDEFGDMAREMGLMPSKPTGYTDDGEAMYSLDSISTAMGISEHEAVEKVERFIELREQAGLSNAGIVKGNAGIHSIQ